MQTSAQNTVAGFTARVRRALFFGGFATGLAGTALALASILLVWRFFSPPPPPGLWLVLLLFPPLIHGFLYSRHRGYDLAAGTAFLDRHLQTEGLLMTAGEVELGAWEQVLRKRLHTPPATPLPRLRALPIVFRPLGTLLFLAGIFLLPSPDVISTSPNPLVEQELEELADKLEQLHQEEVLASEKVAEFSARIKKLQDRLNAGQDVAWSDVDGLAEKISLEQALKTGKLESARAALGEIDSPGKSGSFDADSVDEALQKADGAGLINALDKQLQESLAKSLAADGSIDPAKVNKDTLPGGLPPELAEKLFKLSKKMGGLELGNLASLQLTPEQMAQLIAAMAKMSQQQLEKMAAAGLLDPAKLAALKKLLEKGFKPGGT